MRAGLFSSVVGLGLALGCASDERAQREDDPKDDDGQRVVIVQKRARNEAKAKRPSDAQALRAEREARARAESALQAERAAREAEQTRRELEAARAAQVELARELELEREKSRAHEQALADEQRARTLAEQEAREALERIATVREEARGLVVTLSAPVLFGFDEATLLPSAKRRLDAVADALRATGSAEFVVEGHTDAAGSDAYNLDLSERRAEAVRAYLTERGVRSDQIRALGVGEGRPVASNDSAEGRASNRRVEIVIPDYGLGGAGGGGARSP